MQLDLTRPNTGRILDYWLGGEHNFEIDRKFGRQVAEKFPDLIHNVNEGRQRIRHIVALFEQQGIHHILDFGSSLPTCNNTHLVAHAINPDMKIVYSDIDPVTVAYAREIIAGDARVAYLQCDAGKPLGVLNAPETQHLFGAERRVGVVFFGLIHLMNDEAVTNAMREIYNWCAPGSWMALTAPSENWNTDPELLPITEMYCRSGISAHHRTREQIIEKLAPWQLCDSGLQDSRVSNGQLIGYFGLFRK
jgi:hypothetical protein